MFRGFKVSKGIEFERAVRQVEPDLCKDYRGASPRKVVPGTEASLVVDSIFSIISMAFPYTKRHSTFYSSVFF